MMKWTLNRYSSRSNAGRSRSEMNRTCSPTIRAASYIDGALASPLPMSKSRRSRVRIDCVSERRPLARHLEGVHLADGVHLVVTRVAARVRGHHQPEFGHDPEAISHVCVDPS